MLLLASRRLWRSVCLVVLLAPGIARALTYDLAWDQTTPQPDTFQVLRCTVGAAPSVSCTPVSDLAGASVAGSVLTYHDATVVGGTLYCYSVQGVTGGERSAASNVICLPDITRGMVAYYVMDEGAGTTAADSTANANTGTLGGGATWGSGRFATGVDLAGGTQVVTVAASASLNNLTAMTWAGWVYLRGFTSPWTFLGGKKEDTAWSVYIAPGIGHNRLAFFRYTTTIDWCYVEGQDNTVSLNTWHHVVATGTGGLTGEDFALYLDGVVLTPAASSSCTNGFASDSAGAMRLGNNNAANAGSNLVLDDVRVYNRALTEYDVALLYAFMPSTPSPIPAPQVAVPLRIAR